MERSSGNYDVVIAGAGAAGMMAAIELSEAGKKVLLLEKGKSPVVSNFARAGGPAAADTKLQDKEHAPLSGKELFEHMSSWANHTVNEALLRNVIARTGRAVDRMAELGIEMDLMKDTYGVGFRARHFITTKGKTRTEILVRELERLGGELWCEAEATELILEDGRVAGVKVKRRQNMAIMPEEEPISRTQGKPKEYVDKKSAPVDKNIKPLSDNSAMLDIYASYVILCTGGFQGNPEYIRRFFGLNHMVSMGNNLSNGDGIRMAEELEAVMDRNFGLPGNEGSASTSKSKSYNDNLCFGIYGGLITDHNGLRFMNEKLIADFPLAIGGEAFARHEKTYCIVDSDLYESCRTIGAYKAMGEPENWPAGRALWHPVLEHAAEHLPKAVEEGWAYCADTIEAAVDYFHLPYLSDTVKQYNEMCTAGVDHEFGKAPNFLRPIAKAPFYIFEYEPACWCTVGGIKTDSLLQPLTAEGLPIQGLLVAGGDNGSMYTVPYYDNEGSALGLALGSGVYAADIIRSYKK